MSAHQSVSLQGTVSVQLSHIAKVKDVHINFGSKYFKILTYKILHAKSNTSTLLSLKVKVKY